MATHIFVLVCHHCVCYGFQVMDTCECPEEVGHASSNVTKTSHAPTCNVLNVRQLAIRIDRAHPLPREGCHWERTQ